MPLINGDTRSVVTMQHLGHTYTKNISIVYLKLKFKGCPLFFQVAPSIPALLLYQIVLLFNTKAKHSLSPQNYFKPCAFHDLSFTFSFPRLHYHLFWKNLALEGLGCVTILKDVQESSLVVQQMKDLVLLLQWLKLLPWHGFDPCPCPYGVTFACCEHGQKKYVYIYTCSVSGISFSEGWLTATCVIMAF